MRNKMRAWYRRIALQRSQMLVVPSRTLETIARSLWRIPDRRLLRIPNGVEAAAYRCKPEDGSFPGLARDKNFIVVGTIAGLRSEKNLPRLVRAVAAAGPNVRLAIAGEGPQRSVIEEQAVRLGIADRLFMPGFLKEPARYIGNFDIFALSSDTEQCPIALVEAMAAGLPVAATDVGDIADMVAKDNRPFIVPADEEEALAAAIRRLASDQHLRTTLGEANAARAASEYQESTMFARYRELYGTAVGDR
jgi:glycosyltransferase involved in cell wall biosynthesis